MCIFHLPLPEHLHDALRAEARQVHRPATEVVREALENWLDIRRRQRLADDIQAYAEAMVGTDMDLDPDLEAAGVELLLSQEGVA